MTEQTWVNLKIIGYTPLDESGKPYRPHRSGYSWQVGLTNPPRLYTTQKKAETYSPCKEATAVYAEVKE